MTLVSLLLSLARFYRWAQGGLLPATSAAKSLMGFLVKRPSRTMSNTTKVNIMTDSDKPEMVQHPAHYGGADNPFEVIKVLEAWEITDPYIWQTIKYLARAGKKPSSPELEDLKKGLFYLNRRISNLEKIQ